MQRYSQTDKLLFTADQRSMAFSGLMLPDAIVAVLDRIGHAHVALPEQFPELWPPTPHSVVVEPPRSSSRTTRAPANKQEMRGGSLRSRS